MVKNVVVALDSEYFGTHALGVCADLVDGIGIGVQVHVPGILGEDEAAFTSPHTVLSLFKFVELRWRSSCLRHQLC